MKYWYSSYDLWPITNNSYSLLTIYIEVLDVKKLLYNIQFGKDIWKISKVIYLPKYIAQNCRFQGEPPRKLAKL